MSDKNVNNSDSPTLSLQFCLTDIYLYIAILLPTTTGWRYSQLPSRLG